jgi:hypothetical protein
MRFMTKDEATIEGNLLRVYETVYPRAVEAVATALRPRFESGELRGWLSGDGDRRVKPSWRIERECRRKVRHLADAGPRDSRDLTEQGV